MKRFLSLILAILLIPLISCQQQQTMYDFPLGISYPPINNQEQRMFTSTHLKALNVYDIRTSAHWNLLEPIPGTYTWEGLDDKIEFLTENSININLNIESIGPDWACETIDSGCVYHMEHALSSFETFVRALMIRYQGLIDTIQFGNEWQTTWWYPGTAEDYVRSFNAFYQVVKDVDASVEVLLGGISTDALRIYAASLGDIREVKLADGSSIQGSSLDEALASQEVNDFLYRFHYVMDHATYDVIDIHLYDDPWHWLSYYQAIARLMPGVPITVTEFGGPNPNWGVYSVTRHSQLFDQSVEVLRQMDIDQALYFKLVESDSSMHINSGLLDVNLNVRPVYSRFQNYNS